MAKGFLTRVTYSNGLWISGVLVLLTSMLLTFLFNTDAPSAQVDKTVFSYFPGFKYVSDGLYSLLDHTWLRYLIAFLSIITGAVLLQYLSTDNRLVRVRSFFPFFLYCLISAALFPHVSPLRTYVAALFLIGANLRIFSVLERNEMGRALFDASLLLGLASLVINRLTWLLPFYWLAAFQQQSLNLKTILSSLMGFGSIYWLIGGASFLLDDFNYLRLWADNVWSIEWMAVNRVTPTTVAFLCGLALILIIAVGSFMGQRNQDKLRTRNQLYGFLWLWLGMKALWITAAKSNTAFLSLLMIPTLIFWAHYFSLKDNRFSRLLFVVLLVFCVLVFGFYSPF